MTCRFLPVPFGSFMASPHSDLECSHGNPIRLQSQTEDDVEEYSRPWNERYILTPAALVKLSLLGLLGPVSLILARTKLLSSPVGRWSIARAWTE